MPRSDTRKTPWPKILLIALLAGGLQTACDEASKEDAEKAAASEQQAGEIENLLDAFEKDVAKEAAARSKQGSEAASEAVVALVGDPAIGRKIFKKCAVCHSADKDGGNKVGPALWGILGKKKGMAEGFNFSQAMRDAGGVWTEADLNAYLESPKKFLPGNRMAFAGVRKAKDRADLIAYLKSLAD